MTLKRHAISLVTGIIILVSLCLAFAKVTGCKDKAEAATKNRVAQKVDEDIRRASEPNEPMKYSLPIPTWPDYIELEKDLFIVHYDNDDVWRRYPKGTKIYFKE